MPFSTHRIEGVARLVDEAFEHAIAKGRQIDQIWLGLGAFNLLAVSHNGVRLIILHVRDDDTDFLAQAGLLFLKDFGEDLIQLPEHKRLVTARVLVSAPASRFEEYPPQPASPATTRIPLSNRFLKRQEDDDGETEPVIPKPIMGPIGKGRSSEEQSDSGEDSGEEEDKG